MFDKISSTRLWIAIICGIATFGILWVAHFGFLGAAILGAVVFLVLVYLFGKIMAQPAKESDAAPTAVASSPMVEKSAAEPVVKMDDVAPPAALAVQAETAAVAVTKSAPAAKVEKVAPAAKAAPASKATKVSPAAKAAPAAKATKGAPAAKAAPAAKVAPTAKTAKTAPAAKTEKAAPAAKAVAKTEDSSVAGKAPAKLTAPRGGKADDLKIIEGVGPAMEKLVNSLGFYHYDQIANWTDEEVAWVDSQMKTFRGRIARDKWQAQAKLIGSEGVEAFLIRAKTNNY
jgi:predicted flap endonuclease-1-like 5' DNA nuclease